jgi:hypothetical protein
VILLLALAMLFMPYVLSALRRRGIELQGAEEE